MASIKPSSCSPVIKISGNDNEPSSAFHFDSDIVLPVNILPISDETRLRNQYNPIALFPFGTWRAIPSLVTVFENIALSVGSLTAAAAGLAVTIAVFLPLGFLKTLGSFILEGLEKLGVGLGSRVTGRRVDGPGRKTRRCVVITGASSGIGAALVEEYARLNTDMILIARDMDRLKYMAQRAERQGATAFVHCIDFFEPQGVLQMRKILHQVDRDFDGIDVALSCAGVTAHRHDIMGRVKPVGSEETEKLFADGTLPNETGEEWGATVAARILQVNVSANQTFILTAWALMKARRLADLNRGDKNPKIVIIASTAGWFFPANFSLYSASKAYLYALGQSLHCLSAPYGIEVTTVCPGFIESGLTLTMQKAGATVPRALFGHPRTLAAQIRQAEDRGDKMVLYPLAQACALYACRAVNPLLETLGMWVGATTGVAAWVYT